MIDLQSVLHGSTQLQFVLYISLSFDLQEPVERKLGQTTRHICKASTSYVKVAYDLVYDVPLLQSIKQQLSDDHILEEVSLASCSQ